MDVRFAPCPLCANRAPELVREGVGRQVDCRNCGWYLATFPALKWLRERATDQLIGDLIKKIKAAPKGVGGAPRIDVNVADELVVLHPLATA